VLAAGVARADDDLAALEQAVPTCDAKRTHCFGIAVHVGRGVDGAGHIATTEWIAAQIATANVHFEAVGVGFQLASVDEISGDVTHIATKAERSALAAKGLPGRVIHVYVVGQLDDVDEAGKVINGVTWRKGDRKFVIISSKAWTRVLAHELGHVFGLPHSTYAISIMNKTERAEPPQEKRTFADEEIAAMKPAVKRLVSGKVLAPIARAAAKPGSKSR